MSRIKVLEILEAAAGGTMRHLRQIVEHIDKDQFDLTVAVSIARMTDPERDLQSLRDLGVRVEPVAMVRRPAPIADLAPLRHLTRLMRRDRYDVVHAHSSKAGFLGRLAARRAGISRVFYTPHAFAFQCGGLRGLSYRALERIGASFGGTVIAVSESEKLLAIRCAGASAESVQTIANSIEPPSPPTREERVRARAALGLSAEATVIGAVGRAAPQKGWAKLVHAAGFVCHAREGACVVLIGPGNTTAMAARARRMGIAGKVIFAGARGDVSELYAAMDIFVQPSLWEGLPYALLDAMGRGLPVLATDVAGNSDIVKNGVTGVLVPPRSALRLSTGIVSLLGDAKLRERLGSAARGLVLREHNIADFIRSIEDLYRGQ
jgi:glycosyltransferase involved in cell wall biosynthesis